MSSKQQWGIAAAIVVAGVLLLAGVSEARAARMSGALQASGLGVPPAVAAVVPFVEIGLGAALLVQWQRHAIAWAAVGLLGDVQRCCLVVRLLQGQRPPCACFGSWSARPIGVGQVVRNVVFIAIAVLAATL